MSRRDVIKLLALAGVTATGGYALFEYAPWLDLGGQADQTWKPFDKNAAGPAHLRELVRYATLAASGHNAQPWTFAVGENRIDVYPDAARRLPVVDPHDRELWISLGCALENLLVAARATGFTPEVIYPDTADFIHVRLTADTPQGGPLFDAIALRQNTRSEYNAHAVKRTDLDQLQALPLEPGVSLRYILNSTELETVLEYVEQGNLSQYAGRAYREELIDWLRFNKKEALASLDGLYLGSSGNPEVPRWLGQLVVSRTKPQRQADADAKKLRSSPGAVVVASEGDDKTSWVRTGQVYERLALELTARDLKSAFLNQPLEVAAVRGQFQSAVGLGKAHPQLLVRFGYADATPRSLRRPVEQVIV